MEIRRFFLGITTHCNMACSYCFVKDTNEFMKLAEAERYLRFFLRSAGKEKLLYLYGGEPLIYFDFIQKIIPFFYQQAKKFNKIPSVIIVTNGTIFYKKISNLIKKYQIKVMVSLSGQEKSHNLFRPLKNGQGSFALIKKNLKEFFKIVPKEDLWVSYTLHPKMLKNFQLDLLYLIKLGFENIHIEPVQYTPEVYWTNSQLNKFKQGVNYLFNYLKKNIAKNRLLFNSKAIRDLEILLGLAPKDNFSYSLYNNLRVWLGSKLTFSHFAANLGKKQPFKRKLFQKGFLDFGEKFGQKELKKIFRSSIEMDSREPDYFKAGQKVWSIYDQACRDLAQRVILKSQKNKSYKRYIQEALERAI